MSSRLAAMPLLVLPPDRIARELRAAEDAAVWVAEQRRDAYRRAGNGARLSLAGVWLVGWSAHTVSYDAALVALCGGILLAYAGVCWIGWVAYTDVADLG